ncbi:MarR family winged helix-turn-helix transcriptional regulator [Nocardia sp. NPDC004722]
MAVVPLISAYLRRAKGDMSPEMRQVFEAAGLGARHGAVLAYVWSSGPVSVGDAARQLGLSLTNTSQLSGELTRAGWLRRDSDPADHRRTLLSVPPERHAEFGAFIDRRSEVLLRAMARLTPTQREGFVAGLSAWAEEIEVMNAD